MKQWIINLAVLGLVFGGIERARAGPIDFSFSGTGSGSIGPTSFFDVFFDIQISADTANVSTLGPQIPAYTGLSGTITISGIGSSTFTPQFYVFNNQSAQTVGFGVTTDLLDLTINGMGLDTYGLTTTFGPISTTTPPPGFVDDFPLTNNGQLIFSSMNDVAFSASMPSAVPEPATLSLLGIGGVCLLSYQLRRRRNARVFRFR